MVYADNAATTKLDRNAFEAMKPYLLQEYGNPSSPYSFSRSVRKALKDARARIAFCIHALPEEIYFTSGGTESDNWAFKGFMPYKKKNIITSQIEHHAILNACAAIERFGCSVNYLPVDKYGIIQPDVLVNVINDRTELVSVMLANNEIGTIEPVTELAGIAHENGALFHTDAVQAVGHIPIDVNAMGIDMLSASGHKFNAPKGIGFLYIKKGTNISPYADGGAQEFGMRAGTENVALIVAMAHALEANCKNMESAAERLYRMEQIFLCTLTEAGVDYLRNGADKHIPGNISISIKGANGEALLHRLDLKGIYISTGAACDSINTKISHVIKAINVPKEYAKGTIRVSFGVYNEEYDAVVVALAIAGILRNK
ncbi:MAG: cysteine desulfurase [Eubacterium sp.]|nr:cysteine desulfurase [Eubacterium sp.]